MFTYQFTLSYKFTLLYIITGNGNSLKLCHLLLSWWTAQCKLLNSTAQVQQVQNKNN